MFGEKVIWKGVKFGTGFKEQEARRVVGVEGVESSLESDG